MGCARIRQWKRGQRSMKRYFSAVLLSCALAAAILAGCSGQGEGPGSPAPGESQAASPSVSAAATPEIRPTVTLNQTELEQRLQQQPLAVISTDYIVQDEQYKALYPDMLQAVLKNGAGSDIKDAIVAFVGWDKNNLPVKIKGSIDFSDGSYVREVNYADINLIPGDTFGKNSGFEIDENCGIETFKAIAVSYETFEGDTWENPYYDAWKELYEGNKLSDELTVTMEEPEEISVIVELPAQSTPEAAYDAEELEELIGQQELKVISTDYIVQDEQYKALYPDMLQAVLKSEADVDIKTAIVAFVAWDKNGLPVKIKGSIDFSDGSYVREVNYADINLVPGATFGETSGFEVDENCGIETFKAIAVSYETFEGDTWENPYYDAWKDLYEGQKRS